MLVMSIVQLYTGVTTLTVLLQTVAGSLSILECSCSMLLTVYWCTSTATTQMSCCLDMLCSVAGVLASEG